MSWLATNVGWVAPLGVGAAVFLAVLAAFWPRVPVEELKSDCSEVCYTGTSFSEAIGAQSGRARVG